MRAGKRREIKARSERILLMVAGVIFFGGMLTLAVATSVFSKVEDISTDNSGAPLLLSTAGLTVLAYIAARIGFRQRWNLVSLGAKLISLFFVAIGSLWLVLAAWLFINVGMDHQPPQVQTFEIYDFYSSGRRYGSLYARLRNEATGEHAQLRISRTDLRFWRGTRVRLNVYSGRLGGRYCYKDEVEMAPKVLD
jgi:hypothetical protein